MAVSGFSTTDTIAAIATAPGRGGIGIVRISGPAAHGIALALTGRRTPLVPRRATFLKLANADASIVDQVVVTAFPAPHSYTGDDVVEVSGHGSTWILETIVERACQLGARLAQPGEFTLRAYLNGRMDLVQAEAVADLVNAVTPLQARVAAEQLEGGLSRRLREIDAAQFDLIAKLEASLDFPDEGFHFITRDEALAGVEAVATALERLLVDGRRGQVVREGRLVVIAGRPNVGKSSLFNALVGSARAIVTAQPGTTRDVLTEVVDLDGVPVTLVDTAGIRDTEDVIEAEGVRRASDAVRAAALTIVVIDAVDGVGQADQEILDSVGEPRLVVANKIDVAGQRHKIGLPVSARTGEGLDALRSHIVRALMNDEGLVDTPAVSNQRHLQHIQAARECVVRAAEALRAGTSEEVVLAELQDSRAVFELLTGTRAPDDLLAHIFGRFCIGK